MKKIIIVLLSIIVLILGYNLYSNYQRFHSTGADYVTNQKVDKNYHDETILLNYYQAIEDANSYVKTSWSNDDVDVRNPKDDDTDTKTLVAGYLKKIAAIKLYEDKLVQSFKIKSAGLSDAAVIEFEKSGCKGKEYNEFLKKKFILETFKSNPDKYSLKIGDYSSFVYEIQKQLVKKGYSIQVDGVYRDATLKAVGQFELKNDLLADGKIDSVLLALLLQ